jgi:Uma2 family endonuclease
LPEGAPVELINGRFVVSPSPNVLHQTIIALLLEKADGSREKHKKQSHRITFSDDTILQPDLLYISNKRRSIIKERVEGAPDLVVEIISGSARRDRVVKLDLYARYGVSEYWIVDPDSQVIDFLINDGGSFVLQSPVNDRYQSPRLPEVEIQLADFWRDVDAQMSND